MRKRLYIAVAILATVYAQAHAAGQSAWSYTYHPNGMLASANGLRTDVDDITYYSYDSAGRLTSYDTENNLIGSANALGHTTNHDYDTLGNLSARHSPK